VPSWRRATSARRRSPARPHGPSRSWCTRATA